MKRLPVAERIRKKIPTYCYQCTNGPDLLTVEVVDGVATKIEPNFAAKGLHPADGKVCVKPYGLVQKNYSPHRLLKPMKRSNPRKGRNEDPGWVPATWEEVLDAIAARLNGIRECGLTDEDGHPRVAFTMGGAGTPTMYMGTFPAFLEAWGPVDRSLGAGGTVKCHHTQHLYGELWHRAFTTCEDSPFCEFIVSFGANTEASEGVIGVRRRADARVRGIHRIQIEPHLSITSACSDEWVPIRPKTDSAFLYAMLHVLLHEHRIEELDVPFLKQYTGSPYLVGPNGFFLRDPDTKKPVAWDSASGRTVPYDGKGIDPALTGSYQVKAVEIGADAQKWSYDSVAARPAFALLMDRVADCAPEWAASICDVSAATIRRVASEFLAHARIGETVEIDGCTLPLRPVAITLGRAVDSGWGGYECVWARTVLQTLVGALEVPGGLLGTYVLLSGKDSDRVGSVRPGPDGFLEFPMNPTDPGNWAAQPEMRHAHRTLVPLVGNGPYSQGLGSAMFAWLRLQGRAAETWSKPKPPEVWFVCRANPAISFSETTRLEETMSSFPFVVAFAYTLDETNHFADLILPDAIDLESTQLTRGGSTRKWDYQGWVLRQPVVQPRGEARDFTWIATELARRTGRLEAYNRALNAGSAGIPLKTESYDFSLDVARAHSVDETWDAVCRAASAEVTDGGESDGLAWFKQHGFRMRPFPQLHWYLLPRMMELGLRFELPYQERMFRIGQELANRLHEHGIRWWDRQLEEYETLPGWKDLTKLWHQVYRERYKVDPGDYPFWLLTTRSMQYAWGANVSIQLMSEVAKNVTGHDGIVMNQRAALDLGICEGDRIEVTSPVGKACRRAVLRQGIRPDVILMIGQFGHWKTPFAKDLDMPSCNDLVPMNMDLADGGGSTVDAALVSVRRLETGS